MKVRELIKTLESEEWVHVRTKGSHWQFRHHKKKRTVTIAGKMGADIPPGTLASILKATGLK